MSQELIDLNHVLAPIGVERFFADYWQKRVLQLDIDAASFARISDAIGPLDIARLAGLAKGGTQAWLAGEHVAHSVVPVDAGNAASFFAAGATLYFLNVPLERLTGGVAAFLGAPRQRVIASIFLTPGSGGASPHFDMHENFTVQLTGAKRWRVGDAPVVSGPMEGHIVGRQLPPTVASMVDAVKEEVPHVADLRPGSLLYIPRGVLHRTEAGEESWSLNLSYCRTMWLELVQGILRRRLTRSAKWRGTLTGVGVNSNPGAQSQNILPELVAELRELLSDPDELNRLCQEFIEKPDA
jgi:ribosomal protein L16 Arg81 hydroxylase